MRVLSREEKWAELTVVLGESVFLRSLGAPVMAPGNNRFEVDMCQRLYLYPETIQKRDLEINAE